MWQPTLHLVDPSLLKESRSAGTSQGQGAGGRTAHLAERACSGFQPRLALEGEGAYTFHLWKYRFGGSSPMLSLKLSKALDVATAHSAPQRRRCSPNTSTDAQRFAAPPFVWPGIVRDQGTHYYVGLFTGWILWSSEGTVTLPKSIGDAKIRRSGHWV